MLKKGREGGFKRGEGREGFKGEGGERKGEGVKGEEG